MTTDQKPTKKQIKKLKFCLDAREKVIKVMLTYHQKRVEFFKQSDFLLNTVNACVGVGALTAIGWQLAERTDIISSIVPSIKTSLVAATATVLLLFFGMLLDLTRKEEKHIWLAASYAKLNQEISDIYLTVWENLTAREYEKFTNLFHRIRNDMIVLKAKEPPILQFELFLSDKRRGIRGETETEIILKVPPWQFWMAGFFSMTNALTKFVAKYNYQVHQEEQQEQEQLKPNKDKKE